MRLDITSNACETARRLIADGLNPDETLEFCRGDTVCLRGTARAFASRMVSETPNGPRHVPYRPFDADRLQRVRSPMR